MSTRNNIVAVQSRVASNTPDPALVSLYQVHAVKQKCLKCNRDCLSGRMTHGINTNGVTEVQGVVLNNATYLGFVKLIMRSLRCMVKVQTSCLCPCITRIEHYKLHHACIIEEELIGWQYTAQVFMILHPPLIWLNKSSLHEGHDVQSLLKLS